LADAADLAARISYIVALYWRSYAALVDEVNEPEQEHRAEREPDGGSHGGNFRKAEETGPWLPTSSLFLVPSAFR